MSSYPEEIDEFREMENIKGMDFNEEDKTSIFAEDFAAIHSSIKAIQEYVGTDDDITESPLYLLIANMFYPVGKVVAFGELYDPNDSLGFGLWEPYGEGRVMVNQDSENPNFEILGDEGGAENHVHDLSQGGQADIVIRSNQTGIRRIGGSFTETHTLNGTSFSSSSGSPTFSTGLSGNTEGALNLMPYKVGISWIRVE